MSTQTVGVFLKITQEEKDFLDDMGINQTRLFRDAIQREMEETPEKLEKEKHHHISRLREICPKLKQYREQKRDIDSVYERIAALYLEREKDARITHENQAEWRRIMINKHRLSAEKLDNIIKEKRVYKNDNTKLHIQNLSYENPM